jgi:hypothetical protein
MVRPAISSDLLAGELGIQFRLTLRFHLALEVEIVRTFGFMREHALMFLDFHRCNVEQIPGVHFDQEPRSSCWSTDLRVRAEPALAQNKRTAHCIYRVEEHFNRTRRLQEILVNAYLCAHRVSPVVIPTVAHQQLSNSVVLSRILRSFKFPDDDYDRLDGKMR